MNLLFSPHNDDETLFASFALQTYDPLVIVVFDSFVQVERGDRGCDAKTRRLETIRAVDQQRLISTRWRMDPNKGVRFLGISDAIELVSDMPGEMVSATHKDIGDRTASILAELLAERQLPFLRCFPGVRGSLGLDCGADVVIAPAFEYDGHDQHNVVSKAITSIDWGRQATTLLYATYTRSGGKSILGNQMPASGDQVMRKLLGLAQYGSQLNRPECRPHFLRSQEEYYV